MKANLGFRTRRTVFAAIFVAALFSQAAAHAQQSKAQNGGYSIFAGTMADMTYLEVEDKIKEGAVALWGLGVVEQHGPHLPLSTDVYGPYFNTVEAGKALEARGIPALIVPVYYWGVNRVSGSFTGSIDIRPEIMVEVMVDVMRSLKRDGVNHVFLVSGHGDADHNRTIYEGAKKGSAATGIQAYFVTNAALVERLGLKRDDPNILISGMGYPPPAAGASASQPSYPDVHAGSAETSTMLGNFPDVVRADIIPTLPPTNLSQADLAEWRKGYEKAKKVTPRGYFGAPANANAERGRAMSRNGAKILADAIAAKLKGAGGK